jgi:two-component system response regulator DevR
MSATVRARPIRVMLVEDNAAVRRAVAALLNAADDLEVCGEAATVAEAGPAAAATAPDVVIVDLRLPDGSGVEASREIRAGHAGIQVLLMTSASEDEAMAAAMLAGASAYLVKQVVGMDVAEAVRAVARGATRIDKALATAALLRMQGRTVPTGDQAGLVTLLAEGRTDRQIGEQLHLDEATVRAHVAALSAVLGAGRTRRPAAAATGVGFRRPDGVPGPVPRVPTR